MTLPEKKILFAAFLEKWEAQFDNVAFLLRYMTSYEEIGQQLKGFQAMTREELYCSQLEWVALVAQFDHPAEIAFFKDYWVPVHKDHYDYFIDLSSESLSFFDTNYFGFEPHHWSKRYIFKDMTQFLLNMDDPEFSLEQHFKQVEGDQHAAIYRSLDKRDALGFTGQLTLDPITREDVFFQSDKSKITRSKNSITVSEVNSIIVGLLPHDCEITMEHFPEVLLPSKNIFERVKNIRALIYLLQSSGMLSIPCYSITFNSEKGCRADYEYNTFTITHADSALLNGFAERYEGFKNS